MNVLEGLITIIQQKKKMLSKINGGNNNEETVNAPNGYTFIYDYKDGTGTVTYIDINGDNHIFTLGEYNPDGYYSNIRGIGSFDAMVMLTNLNGDAIDVYCNNIVTKLNSGGFDAGAGIKDPMILIVPAEISTFNKIIKIALTYY